LHRPDCRIALLRGFTYSRLWWGGRPNPAVPDRVLRRPTCFPILFRVSKPYQHVRVPGFACATHSDFVMKRNSPKAAAASPEPAAPRGERTPVELAGLRRRLASMLYESMLLLGVLALTFLVPYLMLGVGFGIAPPGWFAWLHIFVVLGAYFVWYWRRHGQTLAMQTWRLKLVDARDGHHPATARCWLRYALCWPSVLLFGIGLLWALIDRDRQFLHDRLSGTCIVLLPPAAKT
jgi:uncharacterized RDD family membrane protein YckC